MDFLERDLETIIYDAMLDNEVWSKMEENGIYISSPLKVKRQLKIGNYGVADIVTISREGKICIRVWELKQGEINCSSLIQIVRYMKGIKLWLIKNKKKVYDKYTIEGILIGRTVDTHNDYLYLSEFFERGTCGIIGGISIYTYDYGYDGLKFESISLSDYSLSNSGF